MTDRHRSFIVIGSVAMFCALALAFLVPGSSGNAGRQGHQTIRLSLSQQHPSTTTTSTTTVTPSTTATPSTGASSPAAGSRSSQGGNAVAPLGGGGGSSGSGGNGDGGGGGPTTTVPAPTTSTTPTTAPAAPPAPTDCGGQPDIGPTSGAQWTCTFDSEFTGTTLNTNQWLVQETAHGGYHSGSECYYNDPANVNVSGGSLNLTAIASPTPFNCQSDKGSYQTQVSSGMVTSYTHFSQAYGLFEVRAKLPSATIPGIQSTLWLWPSEPHKYGALWPASGEIDFAEWYSQFPNEIIPQVHYNSAGNDPDSSGSCAVNPNQYNTYGVEWTPLAITILYNGAICMSDDWNPALPLSKPEPFDQPFIISMTQAVGVGGDKPGPSTQFPSTLSIQWVRVWSENAS